MIQLSNKKYHLQLSSKILETAPYGLTSNINLSTELISNKKKKKRARKQRQCPNARKRSRGLAQKG